MPKITIQPLNETIDAEDGVTIMGAAHAHGLYWPTTCGGEGLCTSCMCKIDGGAENLDSMGRSESKTLTNEMSVDQAALVKRGLRLACQARVHGSVTVTKSGVRAEGG